MADTVVTTTPMTDLIAALVYLALAVGVLILTVRWVYGGMAEQIVRVSAPHQSTPDDPLPTHDPPYDPCDHPFAELSLDDLLEHLHADHFEVWNVLGEMNPLPSRWRAEHAADHGRAP